MTRAGDILVLGIGNILLQDEGVGVRVARALADAATLDGGELPPGTRVVDGGTLGLDLLPQLAGARALIAIDAAELGLAPGETTILRGADGRAATAMAHSAHDVGLAELLGTARLAGCLPPVVTIVGIQAGCIAPGLDLTPPVAAAVARAVDLVRREAWSA